MKSGEKITLKSFSNRGFNLTPVELKDVVPFEVKRFYYFRPENTEAHTGEHCHLLEQEVFFQITGFSTIVIDRGLGKEEIKLAPNEAMFIPNYVWHGFKKTSPDCLVLALSSTNYTLDRSDYIEDYQAYLEIRDKNLSSSL